MSLMNPAGPNGWTAWDYAAAILRELQAANESSGEDADPPVSRMRVPFVLVTDATGMAQQRLALPPGVGWSLLTYAYQTTPTAAAGYLAFYRGAEEGTSLIKVTALTQLQDDAFNAEGHLVPEQSTLLVVVRGAAAGVTVAGNISAKSIMNANPRLTHTSGGSL